MGRCRDKTYDVWYAMKARCTNPNHPKYKDYGARGIGVCKRWLNSYTNFLKDMGAKPDGLSLDRINNNSGYKPSNCRWATAKIQANNKRRSSGFKNNYEGVYYCNTYKKWVAELSMGVGKRKYLGRFDKESDAVKAIIKYKKTEGN